MTDSNQPLRLHFNSNNAYIEILYGDIQVGFCKPEFAAKLMESLNKDRELQEENQKLNKALQIACWDLMMMYGGKPTQVNQLIMRYLDKAKRPEHGTRAIAMLLLDRQKGMKMSNREFAIFCNSHKLPPKELMDIFMEKDVSDRQLGPISRIVGKTIQELMEIRDGFTNTEIHLLAQVLGTSSQELSEMFSQPQ